MPAFPIIVAGLTDNRSAVARLMSLKGVVFIGKISYSIYLTHTLVLWGIREVLMRLHLQHHTLLWFLPAVSLTIALSWATYNFIETPAQRFFKRLLDAEDNPQPQVSQSAF